MRNRRWSRQFVLSPASFVDRDLLVPKSGGLDPARAQARSRLLGHTLRTRLPDLRVLASAPGFPQVFLEAMTLTLASGKSDSQKITRE
jgi:hypothetical protein